MIMLNACTYGKFVNVATNVNSGAQLRAYLPMNKYDANTFGKRLRVMRRIQGYSQKQLAEIIGTKRIAVVNWEMGNTSITGKNLLLLAKALDVNPYWLYFGEY